jgi:hypothetical protein
MKTQRERNVDDVLAYDDNDHESLEEILSMLPLSLPPVALPAPAKKKKKEEDKQTNPTEYDETCSLFGGGGGDGSSSSSNRNGQKQRHRLLLCTSTSESTNRTTRHDGQWVRRYNHHNDLSKDEDHGEVVVDNHHHSFDFQKHNSTKETRTTVVWSQEKKTLIMVVVLLLMLSFSLLLNICSFFPYKKTGVGVIRSFNEQQESIPACIRAGDEGNLEHKQGTTNTTTRKENSTTFGPQDQHDGQQQQQLGDGSYQNNKTHTAQSLNNFQPFNKTNPFNSSWCPGALCHNSPICAPCNKRYLFILATGRSGSTSLLEMMNKLPNVSAHFSDKFAFLTVVEC